MPALIAARCASCSRLQTFSSARARDRRARASAQHSSGERRLAGRRLARSHGLHWTRAAYPRARFSSCVEIDLVLPIPRTSRRSPRQTHVATAKFGSARVTNRQASLSPGRASVPTPKPFLPYPAAAPASGPAESAQPETKSSLPTRQNSPTRNQNCPTRNQNCPTTKPTRLPGKKNSVRPSTIYLPAGRHARQPQARTRDPNLEIGEPQDRSRDPHPRAARPRARSRPTPRKR
jgi:hypothetical protein